jgi:hypothetical protein
MDPIPIYKIRFHPNLRDLATLNAHMILAKVQSCRGTISSDLRPESSSIAYVDVVRTHIFTQKHMYKTHLTIRQRKKEKNKTARIYTSLSPTRAKIRQDLLDMWRESRPPFKSTRTPWIVLQYYCSTMASF